MQAIFTHNLEEEIHITLKKVNNLNFKKSQQAIENRYFLTVPVKNARYLCTWLHIRHAQLAFV